MIARISSSQEAQRTAAVAALSACIPSCPNPTGKFDCGLLDDTVQALLTAQKDPKLLIRKLAMHGLGEVARISYEPENDDPLPAEVVARYSRVVVDSAMAGLDDTHDRGDQIAIEAVHVLDKMALIAHKDLLKEILPHLLLKIKPCFEKESAELRTLAFSLFAELGGRVGDCDEFRDALQQNIVSICLHLNDEDVNVQQKCAHVLIQTAELLTAEPAKTLIHAEIEDNRSPRNYIGFLKDFSMIFALSFPDKINNYALGCNNYFKSSSARIRMNAAHMTGFLMAALTPQLRGTLSKELIFSGIVLLLKDTDVDVRMATARAISCLHAFQ
ncbi:hypothetical protein L596_029243 [Steinernema carpocapsae]|uniref:Maestro/Maestro-like HEAT-repeats domain-containing protein n=1 Tax=Steinernema carpocapsae TaxID=34508 RepID=A0A4V5ZXF2_STECR|nr:hypothetical protein L596_029243 [Steinernema carpocapsae]